MSDLDDLLANIGQTGANDQYAAALRTFAECLGHYHAALIATGIEAPLAAALLMDYQRSMLGAAERRQQGLYDE